MSPASGATMSGPSGVSGGFFSSLQPIAMTPMTSSAAHTTRFI